MFRVALMGMNYSMPCCRFTQCTLHWLLFLFMHVLLYFIVWMIQLFALASGVNAHICHTGILIHQLDFLLFSYLFSCAISVYLTSFASFRVYEGPISSASYTSHCHMSTMDVFCISKVFDFLYGNKNVFDLTKARHMQVIWIDETCGTWMIV